MARGARLSAHLSRADLAKRAQTCQRPERAPWRAGSARRGRTAGHGPLPQPAWASPPNQNPMGLFPPPPPNQHGLSRLPCLSPLRPPPCRPSFRTRPHPRTSELTRPLPTLPSVSPPRPQPPAVRAPDGAASRPRPLGRVPPHAPSLRSLRPPTRRAAQPKPQPCARQHAAKGISKAGLGTTRRRTRKTPPPPTPSEPSNPDARRAHMGRPGKRPPPLRSRAEQRPHHHPRVRTPRSPSGTPFPPPPAIDPSSHRPSPPMAPASPRPSPDRPVPPRRSPRGDRRATSAVSEDVPSRAAKQSNAPAVPRACARKKRAWDESVSETAKATRWPRGGPGAGSRACRTGRRPRQWPPDRTPRRSTRKILAWAPPRSSRVWSPDGRGRGPGGTGQRGPPTGPAGLWTYRAGGESLVVACARGSKGNARESGRHGHRDGETSETSRWVAQEPRGPSAERGEGRRSRRWHPRRRETPPPPRAPPGPRLRPASDVGRLAIQARCADLGSRTTTTLPRPGSSSPPRRFHAGAPRREDRARGEGSRGRGAGGGAPSARTLFAAKAKSVEGEALDGPDQVLFGRAGHGDG